MDTGIPFEGIENPPDSMSHFQGGYGRGCNPNPACGRHKIPRHMRRKKERREA
jgi:hypothetical protein